MGDRTTVPDWRNQKENLINGFQGVMRKLQERLDSEDDQHNAKHIEFVRTNISQEFSFLIDVFEWMISMQEKELAAPEGPNYYFDFGDIFHSLSYIFSLFYAAGAEEGGANFDSAAFLKSIAAVGGKRSGMVRRANRKWVEHAEEIAIGYVAENPIASRPKIAAEILSRWKLSELLLPTFETIEDHLTVMITEGRLPESVAKRGAAKQLR